MRYGRKGKRSTSHSDGSFWICFSDLMSALMLVFVLVMFYSIYQYFDMLEEKTAELLRQNGILDAQQLQLTLSQAELQEKEAQLNSQQQILLALEEKLNAQSAQLIIQQTTLDEQNEQLKQQQATLDAQQTTLDEQNAQIIIQIGQLTEQESAIQTQQKELSALQLQLSQKETDLKNAQINLNQALAAQQAQQTLLDTQQEKLDKLVGVRTEIIEALMSALRASNITGAKVDDSGAIVFDSEMMFSSGSARLNDRGKEFLDRFLPNYLRVLMSKDYSKYVSQIIIEGHTDTTGDYITNAELSQNRALSVLKYIMSDEFTGISASEKARLEKVVTTNGRSYSDPIYHANGTVNMSASRRVVIKFRLNDEDMVTEMLDVLKNMD